MAEQADAQGDSGRAVLGRTLRFLREKAGKSLGQLADETGYDKSYLSRLESGERLSKVTVMEDLDGYYECGDLLISLWRIARIDAFKDKYKEYMRLEATARIMYVYTPDVPGLLQTEEFAREVLSEPQTTGKDTEAIEEQVAARLGRQLLLSKSPAPSVRFIIDVPRSPPSFGQCGDLGTSASAYRGRRAVAQRRRSGAAVLRRRSPPHGEGFADPSETEGRKHRCLHGR